MRLNATDELTSELTFPITRAELVDRRGDHVIELPDGTETVGDVLARLPPQTYDGPEDVRAALMNAVCCRAVGRQGYSDRDPFGLSERGPGPLSF